jgi:hypothetical protein
MPRKYIRTSKRCSWKIENMEKALADVKSKKLKLGEAADFYDVPTSTLSKRLSNKYGVQGSSKVLGRFRPVFDQQLESILSNHIKLMESTFYGLTSMDIRKIAYQLAEKLGIAHNFDQMAQCAGEEWLLGFMKRNNTLSYRKPGSISLARAMGFTEQHVNEFFDNVKDALEMGIEADRIYNMDESSLPLVHKYNKIIAEKGKKVIGGITSADRGKCVSVVCCFSAIGHYLPPWLIYARKKWNPLLLNDSSQHIVGKVSDKGWMTTQLFKEWFEFFLLHVRPSVERKVLLIMDGHSSHKSLEVILKAKENNVILLCIPAHTSHKLQPLDKSFFGPMKMFYNNECRLWMKSHYSLPIKEANVANIFIPAFRRAATITNAISGFKSCGIVPYNRDLILENNFPTSCELNVTCQHSQVNNNAQNVEDQAISILHEVSPIPVLQKSLIKSKKWSITGILTSPDNIKQLSEPPKVVKPTIVTKKSDKLKTVKRLYDNKSCRPVPKKAVSTKLASKAIFSEPVKRNNAPRLCKSLIDEQCAYNKKNQSSCNICGLRVKDPVSINGLQCHFCKNVSHLSCSNYATGSGEGSSYYCCIFCK